MSWQEQLLGSLAGSGPLALALGFAVKTLWSRVRELEKKLETVNAERLEDLKALLQQSDSSGQS